MTAREWIDRLSDQIPDEDSKLVVMDGFDDCILGVCQQLDDSFVVYDLQKVLTKLQADGMDLETAYGFIADQNAGGKLTPGFVGFPPRD